jgi:hypothetical protein
MLPSVATVGATVLQKLPVIRGTSNLCFEFEGDGMVK